tara:strand:+ start:97 stop:474 length:378 start_codon:yes stop_codon:yes gene_type:complete
MRKSLLTILFILFAFPSYALELLMAHNPTCHICQKFVEEVAIDFEYTYKSTTTHGRVIKKTLPLIIISVNDQPEWFKEAYAYKRIKLIKGTPTFIIWNGRKELGRLVGYYSKERFYRRLNTMFKQ